jgi:putative nucleotidyltransferase with HDIG domain
MDKELRMRQENEFAREGRLEFGTGLRARLERAQTLARERTNGPIEHLFVPKLELVEEPELRVVGGGGDEAFELLVELSRKVDGRENLDLRHSREIALVARNLAHALGLDADAAARSYLAGMFHDLGKLEVPERILRKPGPLDIGEWAEMASHAERGADMVDRIGGMRDVAAIVASHHERWDGVGYPNRIAGETIPIEARIVSAADAFVTMTSARPFRSALPVTGALTELIRSAGAGFDPNVVGALLELAVERRLGIDAPDGAAPSLAAVS